MIDLNKFKGEKFYVVGLGTSGKSTERALHAAGADVRVWDDRADIQSPLPICAPDKVDYAGLTALVLAPGIPFTHPAAVAAVKADIEVISDLELMFRGGIQAKALGITGTNGKSTVAALLQHVLKTLGYPTEIGGNFGPATLDMTDPGPHGFVVLELSSYQLDLSPRYPLAAACLLNMDTDHLERHGTMEAYAAAKAKIFREAQHKFVTGIDPWSLEIACTTNATLVSPETWPTGIENPALTGDHQRQNCAAVMAMLTALDLPQGQVMDAIKSFKGIAHRQEIVGQSDQWLFVNDSKATNVASTARALGAFQDIHWLVGGRGKEGGLGDLSSNLGQVKKAYVYGENAAEVAGFCTDQRLPFEQFETLDQAFTSAVHSTGGTLLLSPAAASWDQYASFEKRGEHFRTLTNAYLHKTDMAA